MNIKKLNDLNYLNDLATDKDRLNQIISESNGYVLRAMKKNNIIPEKELLNVTPYSILFYIENYNLTKSEIKEVRTFFEYEANNKVAQNKLTQAEIEEYLQEGRMLPNDTILTTQTINTYKKEIDFLESRDEYQIGRILKKSLKNLSKADFLSLRSDFLIDYVETFNNFPQYFADKDFKELYKNLIVNRQQITNRKMSFESFRNYPFKEEDRELFNQLLENTKGRFSSSTYDDLKGYLGFTQMINKIDYFNMYNPRDLALFTDSEIVKYKKDIQDSIIKENENQYYDYFSDLLRFNCSIEQFKEVVDTEFFKRFMTNIPRDNIDIRDVDARQEPLKSKFKHIQEKMLEFALDNYQDAELSKKINPHQISKIIITFDGDYERREDQKFHDQARKYYTQVWPTFFTSERLEGLMNNIRQELTHRTKEIILETAKSNPSVNMLTVLLHYNYHDSKYSKKIQDKEVNEVIDGMVTSLDKDSVDKLTQYYGHSMKMFKKPKKTDKSPYESNFLNYKNIEFDRVDNKALLFEIDKSFRGYVLENNLSLTSDLLGTIIYHIDEDKETLKFFTKYFEKHQEKILEQPNLVESILKNPLGKQFIKPQSNEYYEEKYQLFLQKITQYDNLSTEVSNLAKKENKNEWDDGISPEMRALKNQRDMLSKEKEQIKKEMPFEFVEQKVKSLVKENKFEEYINIRDENFFYSNEHFVDYANTLDYHSLLKQVEDKNFTHLLSKEIDYDNKTNIKFNFTNQENAIVAELLLPIFNDKIKVLNFFKDSKKDFIPEFAIKHMPLEIFYGYSLVPPADRTLLSGQAAFINKPYTNDQIIRAFKSAEKNGGFFSEMNINADYDNTLRSNFKDREHDYKELLSMTKESYPKLYNLLSKSDILENFVKSDYPKITKDEVIGHYFKENFDLDAVLKGQKMIIDEINDKKENFNSKVATHTIETLIHKTYYEPADTNRVYKSCLEKKQNEQIVDFLFNEATYFLMTVRHLGDINDMAEHISNNFSNYVKDDSIVDKIIRPSLNMQNDFHSVNEKSCEVMLGFIKGMIEHYMKVDKPEILDYIAHSIETQKFISEQLTYDYKYTDTYGHSQILEILGDKPEIMSMLEINQRKFSLEQLLEEKQDAPVVKRKKL